MKKNNVSNLDNKYKSFRMGALLPIALFLIVSIASLTPFLIHNSEQSAERGIYNGEWAKIQWGLSGLRYSHAHKIDLGNNPTGATTVATISYGDFHVTASIMERKTLMGRNECFSMTPMVYRGNGTAQNPYIDAGYNLSEITFTYDSMPGVAAGANSSFAWRKDGYLYAWGNNTNQLLGLGVGVTTLDRASPALVAQGNLPTHKEPSYNNGWLVATGKSSSLIVDYAGNLYETGRVKKDPPNNNLSESPQRNDSLPQGVLDIAVGDDFMVVIPDDGLRKPLIKTWNALKDNNNKLKIVGGANGYEVLTDTISMGGWKGKTLTTEKGVGDAIGVAAGKNHYVVMTKEGHLWGVGDNSAYQLGSADTTKDFAWINDDIPVEKVRDNIFNGATKNYTGPEATKFHIDKKYVISTFTVMVSIKPKAEEHNAGNAYPKIVLTHEATASTTTLLFNPLEAKHYEASGSAFIWKYHGTGSEELTPGTYTISVWNTDVKSTWFGLVKEGIEKQINGNWYKNTTIGNGKGVYSFYGKLLSTTSFVGVAAGDNFSVAVQREKDSDILYAWGTNDKGQLGTSDTTVRKGITAVPNFPPSGTRIKNVVAGSKHVLCLLDNETVYVWGDNAKGQLGISSGSLTYLIKPTIIPKSVFGGNGIKSIAAGYNHSLAMDEELNVYSWGDNGNGQLGRSGTASIPGKVTNFPDPAS